MTLSPKICQEIITDVIRRHERQVAHLQSMVDDGAPDWEERFRDLLRLETELVDIRQGLQAAAYVALSAKEQTAPLSPPRNGIGQRATMSAARQRYRMG
ncbi:MAG: hypothetical protein WAU86_17680 [Oricola sp.]